MGQERDLTIFSEISFLNKYKIKELSYFSPPSLPLPQTA